MSYCRFLEADVYVFMHVDGFLQCCACSITDDDDHWGSFNAFSTAEMINHLNKHKELGHDVPDRVFENIERDDEENFGGKNEEKI